MYDKPVVMYARMFGMADTVAPQEMTAQTDMIRWFDVAQSGHWK